MVDARLFNNILYVVTSRNMVSAILDETETKELFAINGHPTLYYNIYVRYDNIPTETVMIYDYNIVSGNYIVFGLITGNIVRIFMLYNNLYLIEEQLIYRMLN